MYTESPPQARSWFHQPFEQIDATAGEAGSILVVPVGSVEQHGRHLPVGTDTMLVGSVAAETARRVPNEIPLLVAPPVWSGHSPHHTSLGGTLSVQHRTLLTLLEDVCKTGMQYGFDGLAILNGHGGNKSTIGSLTSTVGGTLTEAEVLGLTYFDLAAPYVDEYRESGTGGMSHGGEFETSLMLHRYPALVGDDRPATLHSEPYDLGLQDMFDDGPASVYREFEAYSDSGAIGDPALATAAKGEALFDVVCEDLGELIESMHDRLA
jgi:creatinine amidohydrolase